jgi:hypothetical protein
VEMHQKKTTRRCLGEFPALYFFVLAREAQFGVVMSNENIFSGKKKKKKTPVHIIYRSCFMIA